MAGAGAGGHDAARSPRRHGTLREAAGKQLQRAGSGLGLQRASTLPTEERELRYAATMPMLYDVRSARPCCCGLWKLQQLIGFLLGVALLVAMWAARPIELYYAANDMLGITLLCGAFWVFEVVPIYITALFPLVLMPLCGITSSEVAAQSYWNTVQMLVIGTFLVDIALEEVHLPRRVALKLLMMAGVVQPAQLLMGFMLTTWVLSLFCNNIAVALLITPFAIGLMNGAEERARDEASGDSYLEGADGSDDDDDMPDASVEEVQHFSGGLLLGIAYSATAGGLATMTGSIPNEVLLGVGTLAGQINFNSWMLFAFPISLMTLLLGYAVLYVRYVRGLTLRALSHEALEAEYDILIKEIGRFSRDELVVGLMQLLQLLLLLFRPAIGRFIRTGSAGDSDDLLGDPTLACLPAILLFLIPSVVRPGQAVLTWPAVRAKFDFGLLLLIGGGFAISSGFTQSGLSIALGEGVATMTEQVHPFTLNLVIILVCSIATQVFSAVGTATTLLPSLYSASLNAVHNPLALLLPATVACSFAFLLPTATPANIVVLAKSQDLSRPLRIRDFFKSGLPLNLAVVGFGGVLSYYMGIYVFEADAPFPKWACDSVSCLWVQVPGELQGARRVSAQACMMIDSANDTLCELWNRTVIPTAPYLAAVAMS